MATLSWKAGGTGGSGLGGGGQGWGLGAECCREAEDTDHVTDRQVVLLRPPGKKLRGSHIKRGLSGERKGVTPLINILELAEGFHAHGYKLSWVEVVEAICRTLVTRDL